MREVTAYNWVPDFARGLVRDLRVRWALEEAGLAHTANVIDHEQKQAPAYLARQPFAQVPAYRDEEVDMFESGAIVLHVAATSPALMPEDPAGRARVTSWAFAALNSVEPPVQNVINTMIFNSEEPWAPGFLARAHKLLERRMAGLSGWLDGRDYLEAERFTAGDLLMTTVLRQLEYGGVIEAYPDIRDYVARCTDRPAFQRALAAQLSDFTA